ncbi:MAG TPA: glycosyltransferase family 4 protein [Firmicutes bacterium]|nr:glycosyltransferase family 4 protein [Bacillota bacterium]
MKILHICSYYWGSQLYRRLFDALARQPVNGGIQNLVYVPVTKQTEFAVDADDVVESTCFSRWDALAFHWKHRKIYRDIQEKVTVPEAEGIHAHSLFSNGYIAYRLKQRYNIPYVVAVRNTDLNVFFRYMRHLRPLARSILDNASAVIFLSEAYRQAVITKYIPQEMRARLAAKSRVIPNGIDPYWLANIPSGESPVPAKDIRLVYAGEITKNKNIEATARACQILMQKGYAPRFSVVGPVCDQRVAERLGKYPFLSMEPALPKEKLLPFMREQDIFVMPSFTETFGLVYAEAMSQGLPVLYTRGQGFDRQFEEGTVGYHVDCRSPQDIADRILDCLANYRQISRNCTALCDKFNWDSIASQYAAIYTSLRRK